MAGSAGPGGRTVLARRAPAALALVAGPLAAALCGACHAQPSAQVRWKAGVIDAERLWVAALERRDAASLARLLAADFVDIDWQGALHGKAEVLKSLAERPPRKIELDALRVSLYGDIAIARGRSVTRPAGGGPPTRVRFTDVFAWRKGGWRALSAQETLERP